MAVPVLRRPSFPVPRAASRFFQRSLALLILSAFLASSAQAGSFQELAARLQKRLDLNLYQLGREVQLGRECGILDAQMPAHLADYDALVEANNRVLRGTAFPPTEKAALAPTNNPNAAFLEGAKAMARIRPVLHAMGCADILKGWGRMEAERAGQAKTWRALAGRAQG